MAYQLSPTLPRLALVTGAARRIGAAIALDLARNGLDVALHCSTSHDQADQIARSITALGRRAVVLSADLAREDAYADLLDRATSALGPVGVLVNNASAFDYDDVASASRDSWDRHMETNLRAPFVLTQAFARLLPPQAQGVVINLIDQRVWNLTPHFTTYTLSKAGLWTLTQTLALALAPSIRVAAIGPGPALPSIRQSAEQFRAQCDALPLAQGTSPEEICRTIGFILSSPSLTGQMIALDGGQHLNWAPGDSGPNE